MNDVPNIVTNLPGPNATRLIEADRRYGSPTNTRQFPLFINNANGMTIRDVDDNKFLDFVAAIAVCTAGHCHPDIVKAIHDTSLKFTHFSAVDFYHTPQMELARKLCEIAPGNNERRVFYASSGAEAVEAALKLARYKTKRPCFISFLGAFHGRTFGALSVSGSKALHRKNFAPLLQGVTHIPFGYCYRCPYNLKVENCGLACVYFLENTIFKTIVPPEEVAAIIVEPIQCESGYIVPPPNFHKALKKITEKHGILFIADEVQTGSGRTGKMFGIEHWDVVPDMLVLGKGIASGMPLAAMIADKELMVWEPGAHATTFGGNPISCAAASATIRLLEKSLIENAKETGAYLLNELRSISPKHRLIGDVRGKGLLVGVEIVKDRATKQDATDERNTVLQKCFQKGLIVRECGSSSIRFSPPLIVKKAHVDNAVEIFDAALSDVEQKG